MWKRVLSVVRGTPPRRLQHIPTPELRAMVTRRHAELCTAKKIHRDRAAVEQEYSPQQYGWMMDLARTVDAHRAHFYEACNEWYRREDRDKKEKLEKEEEEQDPNAPIRLPASFPDHTKSK